MPRFLLLSSAAYQLIAKVLVSSGERERLKAMLTPRVMFTKGGKVGLLLDSLELITSKPSG